MGRDAVEGAKDIPYTLPSTQPPGSLGETGAFALAPARPPVDSAGDRWQAGASPHACQGLITARPAASKGPV